MLKLHKRYSIPSSAAVTKKLTQQYVGPFCVLEKVDRLAYKLDVFLDQRVHPVFSVAQLEPVPSPTNDPFNCSRPHMPPAVFVDGDTDISKSFEVECLLNKRTLKKGKGRTVEYLVYQIGYSLEWNRWYNIQDLDNAADLVCNYKEVFAQ